MEDSDGELGSYFDVVQNEYEWDDTYFEEYSPQQKQQQTPLNDLP